MKVGIKKKGNTSDKLLKSLKDLNNSNVQVGHFEEQGLHYSGMSYVELLDMWFGGVEVNNIRGKVIQDVRGQFKFNYLMSGEVARDPKIKTALNKWFKNSGNGESTSSLLDEVGRTLKQEYRTTFNVIASPAMNGTATPLFETGELAENTAYKTSKDRSIK